MNPEQIKSARVRYGQECPFYKTPSVAFGEAQAKMMHFPRKPTAEQHAEEKAIRARFQSEKPSLQDLVRSGDDAEIHSMGEYWELLKTFAALKAFCPLQKP